MRYGFEAVLTNEFHTLDGTCSSLVPSGPGYENISLMNQVCTTVGSVPGQNTVNGNTFVGISYDYDYSHLWRVSAFSICSCVPDIHDLLLRTLVSQSFLELRFYSCIYS